MSENLPPPPSVPRLRALDVCSGAGGLSLGFQRAGWDVHGVDFDQDAVITHQRHVGPCDLASIVDYKPHFDVDAIIGGPPCQSFSQAGNKKKFDDPRGRLFEHFFRLAWESRARMFLFENVRDVAVDDRVRETILGAARSAGFGVSWTLLNASDYGVPQDRKRFFLVGFRERALAARWRWPAPSHAPQGNVLGLPGWISVRDALQLTGEEYERLSDPAPTMTATEFKSSPHINTRGGNNQPRRGTERILARLDRPSPTIMAGHDPIFNRQVRDELWGEIGGRLSTEQLAVLQGFPRGWSWAGTKHSQQRQIGNAVPPPMAEALGRALLSLSPAPTAPAMATAPSEAR